MIMEVENRSQPLSRVTLPNGQQIEKYRNLITNEKLANYLSTKRIDSFQKLRFLLFLHQYPDMEGTSQEFAEQLYLGDISLLAEIITNLQGVGLVNQVKSRYKLCNDPEVRSHLQSLAKAFEDPLARQKILDQVRHR